MLLKLRKRLLFVLSELAIGLGFIILFLLSAVATYFITYKSLIFFGVSDMVSSYIAFFSIELVPIFILGYFENKEYVD